MTESTNAQLLCSIDGCTREAFRRSQCEAHYRRNMVRLIQSGVTSFRKEWIRYVETHQ